MKNYTLWLSSGQCISGKCDDRTADYLQNATGRAIRFTDSDGWVSVRRKFVSAIAIEDPRPETHKNTENVMVRGFANA